MTRNFSIMHLILAACGGLILGFVIGAFSVLGAGSREGTAKAETALADSVTTALPAEGSTAKTEPKKEEAKKETTKPVTTAPSKTATAPAKTPTPAKTLTKPTTTTTPAKTTAPAKTATKTTTTPAPAPAPTNAGAPKGTPAFSLVDEAKGAFYFNLPTFANDLEDAQVDLGSVSAWGGAARDYAGTYQGGNESEIVRVRAVPLATGRFNLVFSYSVEEYGNDGLAVERTGDETAKGVSFTNSVGTWKRTGRVYATRGQFVRWTQDGKATVGILLQGEHPTRPYVLLRKTGK